MKQLLLLLLISIIFSFSLQAQIVNTEELRFNKEEKLVGLIDLRFGLVRNKAGLSLRPGAAIRMELNNEHSRWLILGSYNLTRFTNLNTGALPTNFTNKGFVHLRYNYNFSEKVTLEVFSQIQFDEIQEIDIRLLNGIGPRFELFKVKENKAFLGILYMYEYEETSADETVIIINEDHRLSTYFSIGYRFNDYVAVNSVTYFQPNLKSFSDYRLSTNTVFTANLSKDLAMNMQFNLIYDNKPPETVPPAMYDISTGFSYRF